MSETSIKKVIYDIGDKILIKASKMWLKYVYKQTFYFLVEGLFFCYSLSMKNTLCNSTNYLNSYDNEAFAPQEFEYCKAENQPKISDFIKRVKYTVKGDLNVDKI